MIEMPANSLGQQRRAGYLSQRWWSHVAALLLIVVELCWILPWFQMVTQITDTAPDWVGALVLGGVMLAAYGVGSGIELMRLVRNARLMILGLLLGASLILAEYWILGTPVLQVPGELLKLHPGAVLVVFFVIWMWWRGVSLSYGTIRPRTAGHRLELGLFFFMAYILVAYQAGYRIPGIGEYALFLFCGLLAVVLARISFVGIYHGNQRNPFDLRWSLSVSAIIGIVVILAVAAGDFFSGQSRLLLDSLSRAVKFFIVIGIFILSIPGLIFAYLLGPILAWIKLRLESGEAVATPEYPVEMPLPAIIQPEQPANLPIIVQTLCFWIIIVVIVIAIILRVRTNLRSQNQLDFEKPESLLQKGDARRLFKQAVQDALEGLAGRFKPARRLVAAARIRRIYSQLLALSAELEHPRLPQQTPGEFLVDLMDLFSENSEGLNVITQAYQRVRYGELPENEDEMEAIETAWEKLQEEAQALKRLRLLKLKLGNQKPGGSADA